MTTNEHVFNVWNKFRIKTMKDYYYLYLKRHVLFLEVIEKLTNNSLKNYVLYPSHYLSAPGLSWDAMLKIADIRLELILVKGKRGRISYNSNRFSKASSNYLKSCYPKQESKHII